MSAFVCVCVIVSACVREWVRVCVQVEDALRAAGVRVLRIRGSTHQMTNAMEKFQRDTIGARATSARDTSDARVGRTRHTSHMTSHITSTRTRAPVVINPSYRSGR